MATMKDRRDKAAKMAIKKHSKKQGEKDRDDEEEELGAKGSKDFKGDKAERQKDERDDTLGDYGTRTKKKDEKLDKAGEVSKEDFEPHMMYKPTGESEMAETYERHLELKEQGYSHEEPSGGMEEMAMSEETEVMLPEGGEPVMEMGMEEAVVESPMPGRPRSRQLELMELAQRLMPGDR